MSITKAQAEVTVILENMLLKKRITYVILVAFCIVLVVFVLLISGVIKSTWQQQAITATLDGILGYTMYPLVKHFFPALDKAKKIENKN